MREVVKVAGEPITMLAPFRWALTAGTTPYTVEISLPYPEADAILAKPNPIMIEMCGKTFSNIWALSSRPVSMNIHWLTLCDVRWLLPRIVLDLAANVRRSATPKALSGTASVERGYADSDRFLGWSLKAKAKKTLRDLIEEGLEATRLPWVADVKGEPLDVPIQDHLLRGPASEVLASLCMLALLQLSVTPDGKLRLFNELSRRELDGVPDPASGSPQGDDGWIYQRDLKRVRPRGYWALFPGRIEVRFDRVEGATVAEKDRVLENVAPTLERLTVGGRTWAEGEWHTFDEYLDGVTWATPAPHNSAMPATLATVRRYLPAGSLLPIYWVNPLDPASIETWGRRFGTVQEHWRKTYRLPRWWADRAVTIEAARVAVQDTQARRGRGCVWADQSWLLLERSLLARSADPAQDPPFKNVDGWAADLASCVASPATLEVVDQEQGIIHAAFNLGFKAFPILPGKLEYLGPEQQPSARNVTIGELGFISSFRLAVVLSLAPAVRGRFYRLFVAYSEAGIREDEGREATGPEAEFLAEVGEAKVPWLDDQADMVAALFDEDAVDPVWPQRCNEADLVEIAKALATRLWYAERDLWVGDFRAIGSYDLAPEGRRSEIAWEVGQGGGMWTHVHIADTVQPPALATLLPAWVLRRLAGEPEIPGGA
ncbi:MAG: hypothetical protein FD152_3710 [Xanthobacteraceae bacterium]|nr:MAG: hypothetical protein FD152_3710 [Xanthobacteraceae bacterium]